MEQEINDLKKEIELINKKLEHFFKWDLDDIQTELKDLREDITKLYNDLEDLKQNEK